MSRSGGPLTANPLSAAEAAAILAAYNEGIVEQFKQYNAGKDLSWSLPKENGPVRDLALQKRMAELPEDIEASQRNMKTAFEQLLDPTNLPSQQNIFLTIGSGDRNDQLWPRPYYDARNRDESVLNLVFSPAWALDSYEPLAGSDGTAEDRARLLQKTTTKAFLSYFPFRVPNLFGIPRHDCRACPWRTEEEVEHVKQLLRQFLKNCLESGKNCYLGYHIDGQPNGYLLDIYNELKAKFPQQIFLLLGHEEYTAVPVSVVTEKQLQTAHNDEKSQDQEPIKSLFKFFHEPKNLLDPEITLGNLQSWANTASPTLDVGRIQYLICAQLSQEMQAFLQRKKVVSENGLNAKDKLRYAVLKNLHEQVTNIANDITHRIAQDNNFAWRTPYKDHLVQAIKVHLLNNNIDKYNNFEKLGIILLNLVSFLFSPIKRLVTGTWFFSLNGKPKEAVMKVQEMVNEMQVLPSP